MTSPIDFDNIKIEPGNESGPPRMPFDTHLAVLAVADQYNVKPDGQRLLVRKPVSEAAPTPMTVILNGAAELKK